LTVVTNKAVELQVLNFIWWILTSLALNMAYVKNCKLGDNQYFEAILMCQIFTACEQQSPHKNVNSNDFLVMNGSSF
jgi:hypothetical protein